ncbi:hypothetical protein CMI48_04780 [Candidatus Pacearchaeota archaeon]|nr:hypothetical protein [Candidatus Pacearchaeota archaeon]
MSWIIIAGLVILGAILLEVKDLRHRIAFFAAIAGLLFVFGSLGVVYFANDVDLGSFSGIVDAGRLYVVWMGNFFENVAGISGYAVQQDWVVNSTMGG